MSKQRVKGNAKTASSAQAANLLGTKGFVGFDIGFSNVFESIDSEFANLDNEVIIILKKLSKKDPQTREKCLRELYDYVSAHAVEDVDNCMVYYATAFPKLALDGSLIVRQLSIKCLSLFIAKLKKSAERHLKKLIPFVLLCTCDISPVVWGQAEDLLKNCFPDGKSEKVIQLFCEETANVCCEFINQRHTYFTPQKYDEEETTTQRESRLVTESLNLLSKLAEKNSTAANIALKLFNNPAMVKKFLNMPSPQIHSALLNLVQKLPSSFNLVESPVSPFSLNNLDSADLTIGTSSFNVLHVLISQHKEGFFKKFDAKKTLIPRLLAIVRKKLSHWRYCSPYLLPSFAAVCEELPVEDASTFGLSFLVSFSDNMPFTLASVPLAHWSSAFVECLKFYLMQASSSTSTEQAVTITVNTIDTADLSSEEVQNHFVELIRWICEKKTLPVQQISSLINNLELNLMNKRPQTNAFITKMLSLGLPELLNFHTDALRKNDASTGFITALDSCSDEYFSKVSQNIDLLSMVNKEELELKERELKRLAVVTLRAFNFSAKDQNNTKFRHDLAVEVLKQRDNKTKDEDLKPLLRQLGLHFQDPEVFLALMNNSTSKKSISIYVEILKTCDGVQKSKIMYSILQSCDYQAVDFVLEALDKIYWDEVERSAITTWLWMQYCNLQNENWEILAEGIISEQWQPSEEVIRDFVPACTSDMPCFIESIPESVLAPFGKDYNELLAILCKRFARLFEGQPKYLEYLTCSSKFVKYIISKADELLANREVSIKSPFVEEVSGPLYSDMDIFDFVDRLIPAVNFYITILKPVFSADTEPFVVLHMVYTFLDLIANTGYLAHKREETSQMIKEYLEKDRRGIPAFRGLVQEPVKNSPIVHAALRVIQKQYPKCIKVQDEEELSLSVCWALKIAPSGRKLGITERFLTRFYCEDTPLEFIQHLHDYCNQDGSTWQEDSCLFSARAKDPHMWQLNVVVLQAATKIISENFEALTPKQLDFIMCGQVAAFETSDNIYTDEEEKTASTEAFLGNALLLFRACCNIYKNRDDSDWKEFYYPFITRIIVRIWSRITVTAKAATTLALVEICRTIYSLSEIPADLDLFIVPDSTSLQLPYGEETDALLSRCDRGIRSGCYLDEFASLRLLTLLAPSLYRLENGDWKEVDAVTTKEPKHLRIPTILKQMIEEKKAEPFRRFAAMQAALELLKSDAFVEEEKLLYCECFPSLINGIFPELIQTHLNPDFTSPEQPYINLLAGTRKQYVLSLIFDICSLIPAIVRTWYTGLPKQATFIINKFILENISRKIITNELTKVKEEYKKTKKNADGMKVSIIQVARQIIAEYVVDETKMILTISMPENYPLSVPEIDLEKAIVPNARAKKWLLQLTAYLFYQNGSIISGIQQWKKNVDKDVEGAEACCICMMTIHSNSHQLPKVLCKQCKNKFHSDCLYKWFDSSNNTQCPLCRNNFT